MLTENIDDDVDGRAVGETDEGESGALVGGGALDTTAGRAAGEDVRHDTTDVRQDGEDGNDPPGTSGPCELVGQAVEEGEEGGLDGPQPGPEEEREGELGVVEVVHLVHEISRWDGPAGAD